MLTSVRGVARNLLQAFDGQTFFPVATETILSGWLNKQPPSRCDVEENKKETMMEFSFY